MNIFEELDTLDPATKTVPARIEIPTPHKIAVLILLKQYLADVKNSLDMGITMRPQRLRMFCMLMFKLIQEADMNYNELHLLLTSRKYKLDALILESFEKAMSDFCAAGIEALFEFTEMQTIDKLLNEDCGVNQVSMMGVYVRRVIVVLERLTFAEMMAMYKNICVYYEYGTRLLANGTHKVVVAGGVLNRSETPPILINEITEDESASIPEKREDGQKNERPINTRPLETIATVERNPLSKWAPKQAKYFINKQSELLEHNECMALSPKQLQSKVQEIMQDLPLSTTPYFLGYMNQLRVRDYFNALSSLHRALDRSPVRMMSQEKGYQYFCINLAVLHATFGHRDEALAALRESIMLAQEHGDKRSLNLANTWYCLLNDELPLCHVQRSVAEAGEADVPLLQNYALALHFAVKLGTTAGYQPLHLFELLQRSENLSNRNNFTDHACEAMALRSAVWCAYGRHELAAVYAQLLLSSQDSHSNSASSLSSALASCALWLQLQGEPHLAQVLLHPARETLPRMPSAECWMVSQCHVIIQTGIYRCRWHDAMKACDQLYLLDPFDAMYQRASIYVARREFVSARRLLDKLMTEKALPFLLCLRVRVLLGYCSLADGHFSSEAVTILLRLSEEMSESQMDYELALVEMLLAQLLMLLGFTQKAYQTIKHCMSDIHINGGLYERAKTDFVFVRCLLAILGNDVQTRKEQILKSLSILERAANAFKKLSAHAKVLDVYVFLAQRFNELGERALRNKYAGEFRRYYIDHPIPREYLGMAF